MRGGLLVISLSLVALALSSPPAEAALDCSTAAIHVTRNIKLRTNLTCGANDAFDVTADHVTIDLNHHTVTGTVIHFGVFSDHHSRIVVKRGTFAGFGTAVGFMGGSRNVVSGITASCGVCSNVAMDIGSTRSVARGNFLYSNDRGIQAEAPGVTITRNVFHGNTHAIYLTGNGALVSRNLVVSSTGDGIEDLAQGAHFLRNTAIQNGVGGIGDGIFAGGDTTAVFKRNVARNNTNFGIEANPAARDAGGNRASGNGQLVQCVNVAC